MRALIYARYSTDRQSESSIQDQLRVCRDCAAAREWAVHGEYIDEGISGAALGNRPGWLAAHAELARGDVLLLTDTTRLSRSQELAPLIDRLRFRGVRVVGVLDGYDSNSPQARMQAGLSGLMSAELRASIASRTHSSLTMRAQQKKPVGKPCYGFAVSGDVIEAEAVVVREIFARLAEGDSLREIARDLNARSVRSPRDGGWRVSGLHELVRNERMIGRVVWNRSRWVTDPDSGVRSRVERPASEWIITEGPPIVDRAAWDRVQARMTERVRLFGGRGPRPTYLLSGILTCLACGGRLIVTGNRGSHYYCGTHRHGGRCSMAVGARRDVAEDRIIGHVRQGMLSPAAVTLACEVIQRLAREERVPEAATAYDAQIAELEAVASAHPLPAILAALEDLRARQRAAQRRAWRDAHSASLPAEDAVIRAYRETVEDARAALQAGGHTGRELLRRCVGGDVSVSPDDSGRHLIAAVGLNLLALSPFAQDGSGGAVPTQATRLILAA
jgi:site-specific DNA recombinase